MRQTSSPPRRYSRHAGWRAVIGDDLVDGHPRCSGVDGNDLVFRACFPKQARNNTLTRFLKLQWPKPEKYERLSVGRLGWNPFGNRLIPPFFFRSELGLSQPILL